VKYWTNDIFSVERSSKETSVNHTMFITGMYERSQFVMYNKTVLVL
jgi:hypothetical protein